MEFICGGSSTRGRAIEERRELERVSKVAVGSEIGVRV
jgi:hypothetical protein